MKSADERHGAEIQLLVWAGATGAACSILGFLRVTSWWPPRLSWSIHLPSLPSGHWFADWSPDRQSAASLQHHALSATLAVAAGLALLLLFAGLLHVLLTLLADSAERGPEWALRASLGATWSRLRRARLGRGLRFAAGGALLAAALSVAGGFALRHTAPSGLVLSGGRSPSGIELGWGWLPLPVLILIAVAGAVIVVASWLSGPRRDLLRRPARRLDQLSGPQTGEAGRGAGITGGPGGVLGWTLTAAQVGAAVPVAVAALVLMSARPSVLPSTDIYRYARDTLVLRVGLPQAAQHASTWSAVRRRVLEVSGAKEAAVSSPGALLGQGPTDRVAVDCPWCIQSGDPGLPMPLVFGRARYLDVGPGFFDLLGVAPDGQESTGPAPGTALVDRTFGYRFFQSGDPAGRRLWPGKAMALHDPYLHVAGMVRTVPQGGLGGGGNPRSGLYLSLLQYPPAVGDVAVRFGPGLDPMSMAPAVTRTVAEVAPGSHVAVLGSLARLLAERAAPVRWLGRIIAVLALLCLLLAVHSAAVMLWARTSARAAELGLHRALGARRIDILRLVAVDAARLVVAGGAGGTVIAASVEPTLRLAVGGVHPLSYVGLIAVAVAIGIVGAISAAVVGWRIAGTQPAALLGS